MDQYPNKISSYRSEGAAAFINGIYSILVFSVYFFDGTIPPHVFVIVHSVFIVIYVYVGFRLMRLLKEKIQQHLLGNIIAIEIILALLFYVLYLIPFLMNHLFTSIDSVTRSNAFEFIKSLRTPSIIVLSLFSMTKGILFMRYRSVMRTTIVLFGLLNFIYGLVLICFLQGKWGGLVGGISNMVLAFFFFHIKDELKNSGFKSEKQKSDPEILDQF